MTSNIELAVKAIEEVMSEYNMDRGPFADEYVHALAAAGLIAGEYVELAPENRLGVGATKEHVIISDNLTRTTIKITHDLASDLMTALLLVKSHREDNPND